MDYNSLKIRKLAFILSTFDCVSIELIIVNLFTSTFILANGRGVMLDIDAPRDLILYERLLDGGGLRTVILGLLFISK
jgi:hypothetical protein